MKSERIITSNRGVFKYKLTHTGFVEFGRNSVKPYSQYSIDRTNIALAFSEGFVDAWYKGNKNIKFAASLDTDGCLSIGCREFNKSTTRLLKKWFSL